MDCPAGQYYDKAAKRCLRKDVLPGAKGKSKSPCPEGQAWLPAARRCVRKNVYAREYGEKAVRAASAEQKKLRKARAPAPVAPAPVAAPVAPAPVAVPVAPVPRQRQRQASPVHIVVARGATSAARMEELEYETKEPGVNATMPPGLNRAEMVEWLTKHCHNTEDPVSLESYAEMDLKDLRSLVRLGSGFCYTAEALDDHIKSSIERDVPVKNMMNPSYRLTAHNYGAILKQGLLKRKTYKLPVRTTEMLAKHYKLYIGVIAEPQFKYVFLYDERKTIPVPGGFVDYGPAVPEGGWLGYIPATGTGALEKLIKKAFLAGRLFNKASRPFGCCRVHVKKGKDYWSDGAPEKISAMEEELRGIL